VRWGPGRPARKPGKIEAHIQTLCSPPPSVVCDGGLASNSSAGLDYAKALGLCAATTEGGTSPGVISATFSLASGTGTPDARSRAIRQAFGPNNLPQSGEAMVVLSTGAAAVPGQSNPAYVAPQPGLDTLTSSAAPADWLLANGGIFPNAPGCPAPSGATAFNPTMLTLRIRVPLNANALKLSSKFLSSEFPEYVCSPYNDFFVVLLDSTYSGPNPNPSDRNLAAYKAGASVYPFGLNLANTGLFTQCVNGPTGCAPGATAGFITSCIGTSGLTGTGFDVADPGKCDASGRIGGGTDWLQIRGNVVPGEIITLRIAIWDTSDGTYDSAVLLDNFTWLPANVTPGAFP